MPNLFIKDVPEELARALRERATRNGRSLQEELMAIVVQAMGPSGEAQAAALPAERPPAPLGGSLTIEDIAARSRNRFPEPVPSVPRGVDIIRADRDRR